MNEYRYTLEKYQGPKTKSTCPNCGKNRVFTRYIDVETGNYLPEKYGRCDRENNCGYHLNPYQDKFSKESVHKRKTYFKKAKATRNQPELLRRTYIPYEIMQRSLARYGENSFAQYLLGLFGKDTTKELIQRFKIGTSIFWDGATVFWLVDQLSRVAGGQVILYDRSGKTKKEPLSDGSTKRYNSWVHVALISHYQKNNLCRPKWLQSYIDHSPKYPCLFGLPQLKYSPLTKPIAIVEAAKTAIIATAYMPQFIWMAVGAKSWLNEDRLSAIKGRKIVLYPDNGGFEEWSAKARELSHLGKFTVSKILEQEGIEEGADLADYLVKFPLDAFRSENKPIPLGNDLKSIPRPPREVEKGLKKNPGEEKLDLMIRSNPVLGQLINTFSVTIEQ